MVLAHNNGTPQFNDDVFVVIDAGDNLQFGAVAWATISVPIDSQSVSLPATYEIAAMPNSPHTGLDNDTLWDIVITNVGYVALAPESPLPGFPIGVHDMNFDNFFLDGGPNPQGTPFCDPMTNNSTGAPTTLEGFLSMSAGSGIHLDVNGGPDGEFGYFLVGTGAIDPGTALSDGFLCLDTSAECFWAATTFPEAIEIRSGNSPHRASSPT